VLFKDAPDLLEEFKDFLPEAIGPHAPMVSTIGIHPIPAGGGSGIAPPWDQQDLPSGVVDKSKKVSVQPRRRRRYAEKESTPISSSRNTSSRVCLFFYKEHEYA
jgi:paired amphipathic helix protein Sin3a